MKQDMELIREILLHVKERKDTTPKVVTIKGYDEADVVRHVEMLLVEARLLKGKISLPTRGSSLPYIVIGDLSWEGHDFIDVLKNETVWNQMKAKFRDQLAELPLPLLKEAGMAMLKSWVNGKLGLPSDLNE
jgi:hypothetical protein